MQVDFLRAESEGDAPIGESDLVKPKHPLVKEHARLDVCHSEHKMIEAIDKRLSQFAYSAAAGACLRRSDGSSMAAANPTTAIADNNVNSQ